MDKDLINKEGMNEAQYLASYDAGRYDRPSVTVDILVFTVTKEQEPNYRRLPKKELRLLMIRRGDHPYLGQWALPGGFVRMDESLEAAALRELKEETNVDDLYLEQLYTFGEADRDPRTRVISTAYMALTDSSRLTLRASQDAEEARWFTVSYKPCSRQQIHTKKGLVDEQVRTLTLSSGNEVLSANVKTTSTLEGWVVKSERSAVSPGSIAFDHGAIIACGIERLRGKIEYTDIAFNLMPELFTLTELQQVYEIILDRELLKANFRRKIAGMVTETDQWTSDAGHRPSRLYQYNPQWADQS